MALLLVGIGGAVGSICRYLVGGWLSLRLGAAFPYGTLIINISASFIIGLFLALAEQRAAIGPYWRLLLAVGFVGGYSTFSTFEYEAVRLLQEREVLLGAVYIVGSVSAGAAAAIGGILLGTWI